MGGARVEHSAVDVRTVSTDRDAVTAAPPYTDILPSLAAHLRRPTPRTLRLSASQTLSRPEYRELSPIQYREVLGGDNVLGNARAARTLIQNADVRWEWYPRIRGAEHRRLREALPDPIERVYLATSGTRVVTFANAERRDELRRRSSRREGAATLRSLRSSRSRRSRT